MHLTYDSGSLIQAWNASDIASSLMGTCPPGVLHASKLRSSSETVHLCSHSLEDVRGLPVSRIAVAITNTPQAVLLPNVVAISYLLQGDLRSD